MSISSNALKIDGVNSPISTTPPIDPAMSPWGDVEITLTNEHDPTDQIVIVVECRKHPSKLKGEFLRVRKIKDCN